MSSFYCINRLKCFFTSKNFHCYNKLLTSNSYSQAIQRLNLIRLSSNTSSMPNTRGNTRRYVSRNSSSSKQLFWRIINQAFISQQDFNIKPTLSLQEIVDVQTKKKVWQASITMLWPTKFVVTGTHQRKSFAEAKCFQAVCQKLMEYGILDENNNLMIPQKAITCDDELENPKCLLSSIYANIWARFGKKEYVPKFNTYEIPSLVGNDKYWKSELSLLYPEPKQFEGIGVRVKDAEKIASIKALLWLKELEIVNKHYKLIHYSKEDCSKLSELHSAPYSLHIPKTLQQRMKFLQNVIE